MTNHLEKSLVIALDSAGATDTTEIASLLGRKLASLGQTVHNAESSLKTPQDIAFLLRNAKLDGINKHHQEKKLENMVTVDAERDKTEFTSWIASVILQIIFANLPPEVVANSFLVGSDSSLLIKKPETYKLDHTDQTKLNLDLERMSERVLIGRINIRLNLLQAISMWQHSISQFAWQNAYYEHMTEKPVEILILKGAATAKSVKKEIRKKWQKTIQALSIDQPFSLDLIHGSDEGEMLRELEILNLDTKQRVRQKQSH